MPKNKTIDLSNLPDEAQQEMLDFYRTLLKKYSKEKQKQKEDILKELLPKPVKTFKPFTRKEIYAR